MGARVTWERPVGGWVACAPDVCEWRGGGGRGGVRVAHRGSTWERVRERVSVCMCLCVSMCVSTCVGVRRRTCACVRMGLYVCVGVYGMCVCVGVCVYVYACVGVSVRGSV